MLYIIIFLILSSSVCIYSQDSWENFVDRLDLLIKDSYLIIECNENEVQIVRLFNTFEELESNLKCKNKNTLVEHGNERVQIIDFKEVTISCTTSNNVRLQGHFKRIKSSLSKDENKVDWPFVHTPFTKEIEKTDPKKMKFLENEEIDFTLHQISIDDLPEAKQNFFIYLDFVNRPMVCRIGINGLRQKTEDGSCKDLMESVYEPVCYYKVDGQNTPSHEQLNQIDDQVRSYVKQITGNYIYIPDINNFVNSNNNGEGTNSKEKDNKSREISPKTKNKKKSSSLMIIIIIIILICLILIIIAIIFFYKKYSKEKNNNGLVEQKSDTSHESQISILSNKSDPIQSSNDVPPSLLKQNPNTKQKTTKRTAANWLKLDEEP